MLEKTITKENKTSLDEKLKVAENMKCYGGSFVQALSVAILAADNENLKKIKKTWPEYWDKYLKW